MKHIAYWTQESTPDESIRFIQELASSHAALGGRQGERIASCIASGDFLSLCDFDLDYEAASAFELLHCRQALAFFTKYEPLDLGCDRRAAAVVKFNEAEEACRETNELFKLREQGSFSFEPWVECALFRAQQKISRVLGFVPRLEDLKLRFGPGATTLTKKSKASVVEKLQAGVSCSEDILPWVSRLLEEMPHLVELHGGPTYSRVSDKEECIRVPVQITDGIVDFVPKNAKIHRTIIKEGSVNTMLQCALGDEMSRRLAAFGIDLSDQSRNQRLALQGSLDGSLATLDLSSASDTISTELVFSLLPFDWAFLLNQSRSSTVQLDGKRLRLEKFSSMGNGFTFPLESLIFWAISSCAVEGGFASVYGDDIVVPTENCERVIRLLEICGFSINLKKSYWAGPFRESCGADYIRGLDIRPYYQKKLVSPAELFRLHNFYVRHGDLDRAALVRDRINPCLLIYGPDGYGDGHLLGDWRPTPHKKWRSHGYGGGTFDTYQLKGLRDKRALRPGDRVLPLYSIYTRESGDDVLSTASPDDKERLCSFLRIKRNRSLAVAPLEVPERVSQVDGTFIKCPSLPGTDGYRRVSIYTFDR